MTTAQQQLVVAILRDRAQAEQAIEGLVGAGFEQRQIHFAGPGPAIPTGGMLEKIKSMFTGQDVSAGWLYNDLMYMGVPPAQTRYYQSEFEAGRCIVAVQGTGGMQMASLILARHGGYGADRVAQSADYDAAASVQKPTPDSDTTNQRVAQSTDSSATASVQKPTPDYDTTKQRVAQSVDSGQRASVQEPTPGSGPYDANQGVAPSTDDSKKAGTQESTNEDANAEPHKTTS